jgi:hypothetical protein
MTIVRTVLLSTAESQLLIEHIIAAGGNPFEGKDEATAAVLRKIAVCAGEDHESVGVAGDPT